MSRHKLFVLDYDIPEQTISAEFSLIVKSAINMSKKLNNLQSIRISTVAI